MQGTRVVTKINGHEDKQSSEIITLKTVKGFNNNITQPNVMISIVYVYFVIYFVQFCYLHCLNLKDLKTVYLCDRLSL